MTVRPVAAALLLAAACRGDGAGPVVDARWAAVTAGAGFTCALTRDGRAFCWGYGGEGQLGNGATLSDSVPVAVAGGHRFTSIAARDRAVCALTAEGAAWCWGDNGSGQLGVATGACIAAFPALPCSSLPVRAGVGAALTALAMGGRLACGVATDARLWCWGTATQVLARGEFAADPAEPTVVADSGVSYRAVAVGNDHACGLAAGRLHCWGDGNSGQLGLPSAPRCYGGTFYRCSFDPVPMEPGYAWLTVAAAGTRTCAIDSAGTAACWGGHDRGALGLGPTVATDTPIAVFSSVGFVAISTGPDHTCAVTTAGGVQCWGVGQYGQLGNDINLQLCPTWNGAVQCRTIPTAVVAAPEGVVQVAAGSWHSCAVTSDGALWCWGRGDSGQLGNGSTANGPVPVLVPMPAEGPSGAP